MRPVVVDAVGVGGGGGVRARHGGAHAPGHDVVVEHRHELVVVESLEPAPAPVSDPAPQGGGVGRPAALVRHGGLQEGDRVAHRPPVGPAAGRREVEELVDPHRVALAGD